MDYDDYEGYYEPSEVDQLVEEFKDKIREHLLKKILNLGLRMKNIRKENLKLITRKEI